MELLYNMLHVARETGAAMSLPSVAEVGAATGSDVETPVA